MTRVLLLGGAGQLGSEIVRGWSDCDVLAPARDRLNIEDAKAVGEAIDAHRADVVVNCAAFHNVDRCEGEPERAFAVNALAVDRLARVCSERDVVFATISTDYVFDGELGRAYTEADAPHPISAYGVSKLAGELLVDRLRARAFVVRTCGIYGLRPSTTKGYTFVDRLRSQARAGEPLRVVRDVVASPTFAGHLAKALRDLLRTQAYGLYHAVDEGAVSWLDFAAEVLRASGIEHPIESISAQEWKAGARRPRYSALANTRLASLGIRLPDWRAGIADYLALVDR